MDKDKRFVAVLNKKIETGKLMNALGHMTAGLVGNHPNTEGMRFLQYIDHDGNVHPNISHYPYIVLRSDNSSQIRTLRSNIKEMGLDFTDFTSTMTVGSSEEQVARTKNTPENELEYWGICFFEEMPEQTKELTKKFSLFN